MRRGFAPQPRRRPRPQEMNRPPQNSQICNQFQNRGTPVVDPTNANLTHRVPGNVQLEKQILDLQTQLSQVVDKQHVMTAEVLVDRLPFFMETPPNLTALGGKTGTLHKGQRITVMYPQTDHHGMIFMTLQHVDAQTGSSQHYQVPLMFDGLTEAQIQQAMDVDVSEIQDSYGRVQFLGDFKSVGL